MRLFLHRRMISGIALLAFLFGIALPALAVVQQAIDPAAFATICRVDIGSANNPATPGVPQSSFKSAHCLMCISTASPPPVAEVVPAVISAVPDRLLPVDLCPLPGRNSAALQPLNPRAPPRA